MSGAFSAFRGRLGSRTQEFDFPPRNCSSSVPQENLAGDDGLDEIPETLTSVGHFLADSVDGWVVADFEFTSLAKGVRHHFFDQAAAELLLSVHQESSEFRVRCLIAFARSSAVG